MVTTVSGLNKPASPFLHRWGGMLWFGMTVPLDIIYKAAAAAKSLQLCPTLCDPIDSSPPGSPVPGILQARTLEWVSISFSNAWKWKVKAKSLSRVQLLATPWTAAYQAPPSMRFSRQEYWSGVPLPPQGSNTRGLQLSRKLGRDWLLMRPGDFILAERKPVVHWALRRSYFIIGS